jgi:hypothetical protein
MRIFKKFKSSYYYMILKIKYSDNWKCAPLICQQKYKIIKYYINQLLYY